MTLERPITIDDLLAQKDRLVATHNVHMDLSARPELAELLPRIWHSGGDVLNYARLMTGEAVDVYCNLRLWFLGGYASFADAWASEGIEGVSYKVVLCWRYAYQCMVQSGMTHVQAAQQPIYKLMRANAPLREATRGGLDTTEMLEDIHDPSVSCKVWEAKYLEPLRPRMPDRVAIDPDTGRITYWHNDIGVGTPMGQIDSSGSSQEAWNQLMQGGVKIEWQ